MNWLDRAFSKPNTETSAGTETLRSASQCSAAHALRSFGNLKSLVRTVNRPEIHQGSGGRNRREQAKLLSLLM